MAFDDLLDQVGGTGRFQAVQVTLLCLPLAIAACHMMMQNFVAFVPPHYCSAHRNQSALSRLSPEESLLVTVPLDQEGRPQRCQRYASPQLGLLVGNRTSRPEEEKDWESDDGSELQGCTDGWTYNMTEMSSTIISEWNLVCDLHALKHMGQTIFMGGLLVGTLTMGVLSDRFGRRILMLTSNLLMAVGGTCASFSSSFSLFCLFRFVCGMATAGIMLNSISLTVEWIPTRVRTVVGSGTNYSYTIGQMILAVVAYFIRDWRKLTLALSLPFYVFFLYSWLFLESVRWLVLKKKPEQAVKNLRTVARINGRCEEGKQIDIDMLQESMKREISCSQGSYSVLSLFRTPTMRTITVCLSAMWFSTGFAYYGLAMDLQKFGVDIFLVQVIFGAVDIPAKLVTIVTMNKIGRRPSLCTALILSGVTIFINLLIPYEKQMVRTSLAVLGKGCLSASFTCCTLYSAEMYPTVLRQTGVGWVNMTARIGAMLAPMVLYLGDMVAWLPGFVYGGAPVISGVVAIFLPETLGSPLPDTIQDVEDRGSGRRKGSNAVPKKKEELPMQNLSSPLMKENA